jgi:hypothetical protein
MWLLVLKVVLALVVAIVVLVFLALYGSYLLFYEDDNEMADYDSGEDWG